MDYPVPTAVRIFQRTVFLPALALLGFACAIAWGDDWPQWRGPLRDGVWREDGILETFPTNGLTVRWRTSIGAGFSGPAVAGGRVFLMDRVTKEDPDTEVKIRYDFRDQTMGLERVLGVDEATGKILWTHSYLCKYSVAYGIGPRATPTVQGDKLYSLGTVFMVPHRDRVFIFNEKGDLILSKLSAKGYEEISRAHIVEPDMPSDGSGGRKVAWAHPAFANRCVYVRNNQELICVSLAAKP